MLHALRCLYAAQVRLARASSSSSWRRRQADDQYVRKARAQGKVSRAAFKWSELDAKHKIVTPGVKRVLELGAAPGSWTREIGDALVRGSPAAELVTVDPGAMSPQVVAWLQSSGLAHVHHSMVMEELELDELGVFDVVASDMAPAATGHRGTDRARAEALFEAALALADAVLVRGGSMVAKIFRNGMERAALDEARELFAKVVLVKPKASRSESREMFLVAKGFAGSESGAGGR
ncbi:ribosomal RNA large subunit methyltransferase J [Thecamonas trahens ATCC 50062]|uniref:rRNA methyltransferase 2, mitochondrial n=1 Tax=Thecamonas trahens ATCC 50062 TaxID=461836 RepID=A0A0L0DA31_THETB|nr:ribosomal RNA large subunit methyltransferase J [Thecamonas trahens ATCC 50062]KNC48148.1 ribosomal RNA large subunit methyltransferase J [Thecamonas trahens ATCC 50062]|eukprot:XP_013758718.1 ribosomal RNA large subunit methyltransferase J [Thecamonas trahens ATCC 50062]